MNLGPTPAVLHDGTTLTLRSPLEADAAAMLAYARGLTRESSRNLNHYPAYFLGLTVAEEAAILANFADDPKGFMLAAFTADGTIVGNIGVNVDGRGRTAHCGSIGMGCREAFQGRGLGTALLRAAIAVSDAVGVWHLRLTVRTFNEAGIRLYERCGFERVGLLKAVAELDGDYADEWMYQRLGARPGG